MIEAAQTERPAFEAVLVRDVTRWGRFQNIDESAFWEFYDLSHGVHVIYIQETFGSTSDPAATIQKMLRRYAAAEFSREKGRLVQYGRFRSTQAGFRGGSRAPYGMVRVLVAADGTPIQKLKPGQVKLLNPYRIKLAAGDPAKIAIIRSIFRKKIRSLSGGEKSRLVIARMLLDPPNFLVLDEPTNHLDLATKEMLVEALHDFQGTMIFVSHDRTFLRGLSNRVLELAGDEHDRPLVYGGTYEEYVAKTGREAPGVHA